MSSDSDSDDFSYTNAAAILKNFSKKKTVVANTDNDSPDGTFMDISRTNFLDTSETIIKDVIKENSETENKQNNKTTTINLVDTCKDEDNATQNNIDIKKSIVKESTNASIVEIKDNDVDKSFDIISTIDACLERNFTPRGRRRGTGVSTQTARGRGAARTPRGRGAARTSRGRKRGHSSPAANIRNKRGKNYMVIDTVEIDPDYPILNTAVDIPVDVNYEVTIKVLWKSQHLEKFNMKRFDKLDKLFKFFAKKEKISEERLFFTLKDHVVSKADTAYSLDINAASIIEGGILSENTYLSSAIEYSSDMISLKVNTKDKKRPINVTMKVTDVMEVLFVQCAQEMNLSIDLLKFYFDGDLISNTDTPVSLELEEDECIDCVVIS